MSGCSTRVVVRRARLGLPGVIEAPRLARSQDGGATWGAPVVVDDAAVRGRALVTMDVDARGRAFVGYYLHEAEHVDFVVAVVVDDEVVSRLVVGEATARIEPTTIDPLGHYVGIAAVQGGAFAVWVAGAGEATDLQGARLRLR